MKTKMLITTFVLGLATAGVCLAGDSKAEKALRDADDSWSKAAASKDLGKIVSYYSADASVLPPNAPIATTKEAIKKIWQDMLAIPGFAISWKATKVEVAKSSDLGFVSGAYELTITTPAENRSMIAANTSRFGKRRPMESGNAEPIPGTPIFRHPRRHLSRSSNNIMSREVR